MEENQFCGKVQTFVTARSKCVWACQFELHILLNSTVYFQKAEGKCVRASQLHILPWVLLQFMAGALSQSLQMGIVNQDWSDSL